MAEAIGKRCWVVPDGFIPKLTDADRATPNGYVSHECVCLVNTGPKPADIELTVYFEDKAPVVVPIFVLAPQRCRHLRMDELKQDGKAVIERGGPYALRVQSDEPIVVQMSRLDTTQANMAFLSTMGFAAS